MRCSIDLSGPGQTRVHSHDVDSGISVQSTHILKLSSVEQMRCILKAWLKGFTVAWVAAVGNNLLVSVSWGLEKRLDVESLNTRSNPLLVGDVGVEGDETSKVTNRGSLGKLIRDCTFIRKSVVSVIHNRRGWFILMGGGGDPRTWKSSLLGLRMRH